MVTCSVCFRVMSVYFRGADGLMLVFDVTSEESFENIRKWMRDIDKHVEKASVQKMLVGNKADSSEGAVRSHSRLPHLQLPAASSLVESLRLLINPLRS